LRWIRILIWGVSNPPGRPRGGTRRKTGGCSRPCSISDAGLSASRARHRAPRLVFYFSAYKSSVWTDLRKQPSRTPFNRPSVSTDNFAFRNCANHRSLSRPPSRRQPFPSWSLNQGGKAPWKPRGSASEMSSGSDRLVTQSARSGEGDDTLQPWRERPQPWPRARSQTRPDLVVAHATVLRLSASSPAAGPRAADTAARSLSSTTHTSDLIYGAVWTVDATRLRRVGATRHGTGRGNTPRGGLFPPSFP
jgi:hypothetical protein